MIRIVLLILILGILGITAACSNSVAPSPEAGQNLAVLKGCAACHAADDASGKLGPSWAGLYESQVELDDGSYVIANKAYLRESILEPSLKIVRGYNKGSMPKISLTEDELASLIAYIITVE